MSLSALIIAKDEERDLPGCLESLKGVADETVVLVSADTSDRTEELARAAGCKVARRAFDGFQAQRQAALELCGGDWVLWIDADERLDAELRESVRGALRAPRADAYRLVFSIRFLGRIMRWGGLGRETHVRLFRRAAGRFTGGAVHEGLAVAGTTAGPLSGHVVHEPYRDLSEYLQKLDLYTSLAARKKHSAGRRFGPWHHLILPWELFRRLVLLLGVLDGGPGLVWAGLSAFHHWLKYVKLAEMEASR